VRHRGVLDPDYVQDILRQHMQGRADRGAQLWGLMQVELWMRQFLDESAISAASEARTSMPSEVA